MKLTAPFRFREPSLLFRMLSIVSQFSELVGQLPDRTTCNLHLPPLQNQDVHPALMPCRSSRGMQSSIKVWFSINPQVSSKRNANNENIVGDWKPSLVSMNGGRWVTVPLALGRAPASPISTDLHIY